MGYISAVGPENNDGCGVVAVGIIVLFVVFVLLAYKATHEKSNSVVEQPTHVELNPEHWYPAVAPRGDVDCWRSGHSVVCLPKSNTSSETHQ